jgi:hypothetical protein
MIIIGLHEIILMMLAGRDCLIRILISEFASASRKCSGESFSLDFRRCFRIRFIHQAPNSCIIIFFIICLKTLFELPNTLLNRATQSDQTKYDRINCKKYHNQETTEIFFKVPGVLFCTIFDDCLNADWLIY